MDRIIYLAMKGADRYLNAQSLHANNLANANTTGFKSDLDYFTDQALDGAEYQSVDNPYMNEHHTDFTPGALRSTSRDLDIAIGNQGWLAVQSATGEEAYTRNGELTISNEGLLQTRSGELILGDGGPITVPPAQKINIARDGTISIEPLGSNAGNQVVLERLRLVNPDVKNLGKGEDGLFHTKDGSVPEVDAAVQVIQGSIEGSNVNMVEEMITMMDMARHYEVQVKLMKAAEQDDTTASNLLRTT